jgi:peroxiredoxin
MSQGLAQASPAPPVCREDQAPGMSRFPDAAFNSLNRFAKMRGPSLTLLTSLCEGSHRQRSLALAKEFLLARTFKQRTTVPRSNGWRRLVFVALCLTGSLTAMGAAAHALLGRDAPDFALHAVVGNNVRLSEHRGEVVVLSFWSSRCSPCRAQLDALDRSLRTYSSVGLRVFGIGVDDDPTRALEFAEAQAVEFPLLLDPRKTVSRSFQVDNLPMTVLIDRNGIVRHVHRDYSGKEEALYLQELRALLNE